METETIRSYENCCRTCMKEDSLMFDLFIERLEATNIADMLVSCTKLKIDKNDTLPRQICRYCYNCLVSFCHFRNMAEKAEAKLNETILDSSRFNHDNNEQGEFFEVKIESSDDKFVITESLVVKQEDHEMLDENKNSELYTANISKKNDCSIAKCKKVVKPKLKCNFCHKKFSKLSKLEHHRQKYPENSCRDIQSIKPQNENILAVTCNKDNTKINIEKSNADLGLICIICTCRFESVNSLSIHMKEHVEKYPEVSEDRENNAYKFSHQEAIQNDDCISTLKSTLAENGNICKMETLEDVKFQCSICFSKYKNINSLSAHMRKHTEKGRVISCRVCKKVFKKISHLKRHEVQHETNCPYKCSMCPKAFLTEELLKDHFNKHKGVKPHGCPVCGKKFSHLSTLTAHIKIHTRDKAYLCPTCGKKFDSSTNLNQHMLRHTGLKEFACPMCPKRFVSKGELKSHSITHTGERSYTCDQCGSSFTKRSSLTKHKIRHLGLKPYQCETCSTKFTCKEHLKRHYRIHTGEKPYKCDICDRAFTQSNDLVKHRRAHVGDKVYKCPQCSESFRLQIELRQHISEHFISSQLQVLTVKETTPNNIKDV